MKLTPKQDLMRDHLEEGWERDRKGLAEIIPVVPNSPRRAADSPTVKRLKEAISEQVQTVERRKAEWGRDSRHYTQEKGKLQGLRAALRIITHA